MLMMSSDRISQQRLESYLWGAATLLRGTIDAGDYKQFIFPLLFFKRLCDVFDEVTRIALKESGGDKDFAAYPENHRFQVPPDAHWREVRKAAKNVGQALQSAMRGIETANPDKLYRKKRQKAAAEVLELPEARGPSLLSGRQKPRRRVSGENVEIG